MPNVAEKLKSATEILLESGVAAPRREAASILAFALQKDKTFLVAHSEYELSEEEEKRFQNFLNRRAGREPFQYITQRQEFFGLDFLVTPDVLIPRPETELIVESAIEILREKDLPQFCEVGVGSGCISISILHENKTARAVGLDVSEKALQIAAENAERHAVSERMELKISDVFADLTGEKFDLIVSNPPYISIEEFGNIQLEVRDFEPQTALTDGEDGLTIIEKIIAGAPKFLKPNSFLLLEIGFGQAKKVRAMFSPQLWNAVEILPDLQNIPRTVRARLKN
ncbi:MAG: peptide chain release factor N(5)-glutamine methyltransferase [Acidobacteriota bacterium]|nr:peptide chain release factor N(5)-glutamine methyltransferase [Acidobacteriota bacterium]